MKELLNEIINLIGSVPTFVWAIIGGVIFLFILLAIVLLITIIKFLRRNVSMNFIDFIKHIVSKAFSKIRRILNGNSLDTKNSELLIESFIDEMKSRGYSNSEIHEEISKRIS